MTNHSVVRVPAWGPTGIMHPLTGLAELCGGPSRQSRSGSAVPRNTEHLHLTSVGLPSDAATGHPAPGRLSFPELPSTLMNLHVPGCGPQKRGPRKPPCEETPAIASLQKPPGFRAHTKYRFHRALASKGRRTARGLPLDFILTPQAAAGALPAIGTQAVKPCPLDKGKANPVPSEGTQVGLTRLRDLAGEPGRGEKWKGEERAFVLASLPPPQSPGATTISYANSGPSPSLSHPPRPAPPPPSGSLGRSGCAPSSFSPYPPPILTHRHKGPEALPIQKKPAPGPQPLPLKVCRL